MSLDVYLMLEKPIVAIDVNIGHIFIRENGAIYEITREEWDKRHPGIEPVVTVTDADDPIVFSANITHNLGEMASKADLYTPLWRPEEVGITRAEQLIPILEKGLEKLRADPQFFRKFNPPNGWGDYEGLVEFVETYLNGCREYPKAMVKFWR